MCGPTLINGPETSLQQVRTMEELPAASASSSPTVSVEATSVSETEASSVILRFPVSAFKLLFNEH